MRDAERKQIVVTARESRRRGERLVKIGHRLQRCADELDELLGSGDCVTLRGSQIDDKLAELVDRGETWHYRDLLDLLRSCGYEAAGVSAKDTLLATLSRSERFESIGKRSGNYKRVR